MPDPETLAHEAEGDSVTPARLVGDADGFPNLGPYLQSGQEPQHLIPLDAGDVAVRVGICYFDRAGNPTETSSRQTRLEGTGNAVAVLTWDELLTVVGESLYEIPYGGICGVIFEGDRLEVHRAGARDSHFHLADDADEAEVRAAVGHLREGVRHHRSDGHR